MRTYHRELVLSQVGQGDHVDLLTVQSDHLPRGKAVQERDPINLGQDFDPHRRHPHADDLATLEEQLRRQSGLLHTEPTEDVYQFGGVVRGDSNPHVHVRSCAGIAVVAHGVSSDQQVLDLSFVQQLQEFSEVGG